jgi:hypothetical protein
MRRPALLAVVALALLPASAAASTINLALFAFDNLIPASSTPGVNVLDLSNFTGATFSLPRISPLSPS